MAGFNIFTNNYSSQNSLFGNLSKSSSTFSLGEYGLIRNGAYKKLIKSYYNDSSNSKVSGLLSAEQKNANKIAANNYMSIKNEANNLNKSLNDITSKADELFVTKEENGKNVFDSEKALDAVKKFVNDYNTLIDSVSESDDNTILRNGVWMTGEISAYSKALGDVGISIGADNKLSVDETAFAKSEVSDLKTLFSNNSYSFAGSISAKASTIASQSTLGALKLTRTGGSLYTKNAAFTNFSSGNWFDSIF